MAGNPWLAHLKKVWAVQKKKGKTYRETMIIAKKKLNITVMTPTIDIKIVILVKYSPANKYFFPNSNVIRNSLK